MSMSAQEDEGCSGGIFSIMVSMVLLRKLLLGAKLSGGPTKVMGYTPHGSDYVPGVMSRP